MSEKAKELTPTEKVEVEKQKAIQRENDAKISKKAEAEKKLKAKKEADEKAKQKAEAEIADKLAFDQHQEYCKLKLEFESLTKEGKKKFLKMDRMKELELICEKFEGKKSASKKVQGLRKMSVKGVIVFLTQEINNPKMVMDKFNDSQKELYFK
jgi:hypothetical protein